MIIQSSENEGIIMICVGIVIQNDTLEVTANICKNNLQTTLSTFENNEQIKKWITIKN